MGLEPVLAHAGANFEWYAARIGLLHVSDYDLLHSGEFVWLDVEDKFVVDLQYHA